MTTDPELRVLIVHGEPVIAAGLYATLLRQEEFAVSPPLPASFDTVPSDYALADVVLADCETGIRLARSIQSLEKKSRPSVVIVTQDEREVSIRSAIEGGVRGYLFLRASPNFIVQAIRNAARGGTVMDPIAASKMVDSMNGDSITRRELEVLHLVTLGSPNKIIAFHLGIAIGTVKCHLKRLFSKLDARSRAELAAIARRRGLLATHVPGTRDNESDDVEVPVRNVGSRALHLRHQAAALASPAGAPR